MTITAHSDFKPGTGKVHPDTMKMWTELWDPVFKEAGTELEDPKCFALVTTDLHKTGVFKLFAENFPEGELRKFSGNGNAAYYVYLSALQKAIRFGLPELALYYYRCLVKNGFHNQTRARLRTIFVEDIGLGDPILCLYLLHVVSGKGAVVNEIIEYLIVVACNTTKSRIQTDVIQTFFYPGANDKKANFVKKLVQNWTAVLEQIVEGEASNLDVTLLAMLLRGSKHADQFPSVTPLSGVKNHLIDLYQIASPNKLLTRLISAVSNMYPPFAIGLAVAWQYLEDEPLVKTPTPFEKPDGVMIANILSAAFDQHTQTGKKAFAYVMKSHNAYYQNMPDIKVSSYEVFGHAVFRVEGSYLAQHVSNKAWDALFWSYMRECWEIEGLSPEDAMKTYTYLAENPEPLHKARERIWL